MIICLLIKMEGNQVAVVIYDSESNTWLLEGVVKYVEEQKI